MSEPAAADPRRRLMRVGDSDREQMVSVLQRAAAEGRLTLDELDERVHRAYDAKTFADLEALVSDLPGAAAIQPAQAYPQPAPGSHAPSVSVAVMSGAKRAGPWTVPAAYTAVAVMGGVDLDLRHARFSAPEVTIRAFCLMGGVRIFVGEDIDVDVAGFGFMGAFDHRASGPGTPGAPRVRVTGFALMGGVEVRRLAAAAELPD